MTQLRGEGPDSTEPELCHTAGEGFSLKYEDRMVLMDALYREGYPEDQLPSENMMARMEAAAAPYDEVDLVTVSHRHIDHFGIASILEFMHNNPGAHLLLPHEAAEELIAAGGGRFGQRIRAATPERGHPQTLEINGFRVTVFNLDHRTEVENIGIIVRLGGKTYFHLGDFSGADFKANAVSGIAVDYLLTPYWYLRNEQNFKLLTDNIQADYLIPMHLPRPDPPEDFIERRGSFANLMASVETRAENVRVLYEEGACLPIETEAARAK
jgi:L-ascorbate metabolism protein UlaG (beta-lactamase superfamily)